MPWSWAALMPHPPIIVPEVGYGREKAATETLKGTERICAKIKELNRKAPPEVLLLLSPHESYTPGMLYINSAPALEGSLVRFGAPKVRTSITTSVKDLQKLATELSKAGIPFGTRDQQDITADHASLVPLYFLTPTFEDGKLPPMIVANPCGLSMEKAVAMGKMLRAIADDKRWALLASGDLSHRLKQGAPSGFHPDGHLFDEAVVEALKAGDSGVLTGLSPTILKNAGECGLRPSLILLGLCQTPLEVFSYEGPFGVGYCNALWSGNAEAVADKGAAGQKDRTGADTTGQNDRKGKGAAERKNGTDTPEPAHKNKPRVDEKTDAPKPEDNSPATPQEKARPALRAQVVKAKPNPKVGGIRLIPRKVGEEKPSLQIQASMLAIRHTASQTANGNAGIVPEPDHPYAHLARKTIEARLRDEQAPGPADIEALSPDRALWQVHKGCFVSIKNKNGSLRGCIGTFGPTQPDLAREIMQNAVSAATRDPRFPPMKAEELDNVDISVDVLNPPELLQEGMELAPSHWGVIVSKGMRRGLLLPDLPTVTSVEQQLTIAAQKGGIDNLDDAEIRRFSISRHLESKPGKTK